MHANKDIKRSLTSTLLTRHCAQCRTLRITFIVCVTHIVFPRYRVNELISNQMRASNSFTPNNSFLLEFFQLVI